MPVAFHHDFRKRIIKEKSPGVARPSQFLVQRGLLDLGRLGRLAHDLIALIDGLEKRGIGLKAINSPMDTTTPTGRAFLQIQAAFAEMERNLIA